MRTQWWKEHHFWQFAQKLSVKWDHLYSVYFHYSWLCVWSRLFFWQTYFQANHQNRSVWCRAGWSSHSKEVLCDGRPQRIRHVDFSHVNNCQQALETYMNIVYQLIQLIAFSSTNMEATPTMEASSRAMDRSRLRTKWPWCHNLQQAPKRKECCGSGWCIHLLLRQWFSGCFGLQDRETNLIS